MLRAGDPYVMLSEGQFSPCESEALQEPQGLFERERFFSGTAAAFFKSDVVG